MSKNYNIKETKQKDTFSKWKWATMPYLWEHLSIDCELWVNGKMEEREGEWLERQMVSRHSHGKHNDRERMSVLRVTPHPSIYSFFYRFRVLSHWSRIYPLFWALSPFLPILSSFGGFKLL